MARPESPIITRERAADIALEIIDTRGLEKLSLRQVAVRMGVKGASLYHHFNDRDDLLAEVARLLLSKTPLPPISPATDWKEALISVCHASWRSVLKHPNAAPLLLQFFPKHLLIHTYEYWTELLSVNGVAVGDHLWILEASSRLSWGQALFAASSRSRGLASFPDFEEAQYPHLRAAIRANTLNDEENFLKTLRAFLSTLPDNPAKAASFENAAGTAVVAGSKARRVSATSL